MRWYHDANRPPTIPDNAFFTRNAFSKTNVNENRLSSFAIYVLVLIVFVLFLLSGNPLKGQTNSQLSSPTGHINDFAGVVDPQSKGRLESLLENLKAKTKVAFYVVTVDTTGGQDIFKFSQELAASWNIGSKTSSTKTLLLVISVGSKTSFTQFSKLAQVDLPEGVGRDVATHANTAQCRTLFRSS